MADECDVSKIVTTFLFNTCRLVPRLTERHVQAVIIGSNTAALHPDDEEEASWTPLTTGSVAEFYIEPMLPHVGDIDLMHYLNTMLAIQQGHPPPTQLPVEFHCYVYVYELIDSHLPGYVYLQLRYLLTQRIDNGKFDYVQYEDGLYEPTCVYELEDKEHKHGPAMSTDFIGEPSLLSVDAVRSVRCLQWPLQATDCQIRHRNYGWPDSATLERVVSNGCDVVGVAHRQCRQDEWMGICVR